MGRWTVRMATVMSALAASIVPAARASAKRLPCTKLSYGTYQCSFYPPRRWQHDPTGSGAVVPRGCGGDPRRRTVVPWLRWRS
jgi:hypothetical protein